MQNANLTNADANQINSQARMIEAHNDQVKTNSAVEYNNAILVIRRND
jgi:hypothetical protein